VTYHYAVVQGGTLGTRPHASKSMTIFRFLSPILLLPGLLCAAETPSPAPVDVAELVRQAVESNPERQAYVAALAAERESGSAASSNPDPVLSLEVGRKRLRDAGGAFLDEGQVWTASLSQTFEWPERLRLRRAIADRQIEAAKLGLGRFEQALEAKAAVLAYRLSRAQVRAQACEEVAARFAGLRKALVGRDPSGPAPTIELRSVEAAEVVARRRAEEARLALQQALLEMNQLRGAPSLAPLAVKAPVLALKDAPKLEELLAAAQQGNFSYRMHVLESEQLSLQSDLARSDSVRGFTAGPYVSQDRVGGRETIVGLRFDIPLPVSGRSSAAERSANERRRQSKSAISAAWRDVEKDLGQTWLSYASKVDQLRMHKDDPAVRFSEAAKLAESHFRAGALSLQLFMDAQAGYLEAVDSALLIQEQAVEAGFHLRELSGVPFNPVASR
jgi:outer membrane protein, heavy metal efflux system